MKKTLKSGPFKYDVLFQRTDSDHGATCTDKKLIIIDNKKSLQNQKETFLHEILHVCVEDFPGFDSDNVLKDPEEALIRLTSPRLMQILKDNKWVREFLFE